jgi:hypothetical protein
MPRASHGVQRFHNVELHFAIALTTLWSGRRLYVISQTLGHNGAASWAKLKSRLSTAAGGPETLFWTNMPDLSPGKGELLVAIRAAGDSFPDIDRAPKSAGDDAGQTRSGLGCADQQLKPVWM